MLYWTNNDIKGTLFLNKILRKYTSFIPIYPQFEPYRPLPLPTDAYCKLQKHHCASFISMRTLHITTDSTCTHICYAALNTFALALLLLLVLLKQNIVKSINVYL